MQCTATDKILEIPSKNLSKDVRYGEIAGFSVHRVGTTRIAIIRTHTGAMFPELFKDGKFIMYDPGGDSL